MPLTSKRRAALRRCANTLSPVFQVGKGGIDAPLVTGAGECLASRELIKLRVLESCPAEAREVAAELAAATGAQVVQVIGRVIVLFRKKKKDSAFTDLPL